MKALYFCFLFSPLGFVALAQYAIPWHTIDGGGGRSPGGIYSVTGTIGQLDAGGPMTNGQYAVTGGFWALPIPVQRPTRPCLPSFPPGQGRLRFCGPRSPSGSYCRKPGHCHRPTGSTLSVDQQIRLSSPPLCPRSFIGCSSLEFDRRVFEAGDAGSRCREQSAISWRPVKASAVSAVRPDRAPGAPATPCWTPERTRRRARLLCWPVPASWKR